ncbi:MAG TPA: acetate/propionate family kinase [Nitrosospira sp.]|nr:acetate/propionate family kinase [Nitrosospira sp.]
MNTGSSSVRLGAFTNDGGTQKEVASARLERSASSPANPEAALTRFMEAHGFRTFSAAAHRVVHGGKNLTESRLIDEKVEQEIERLAVLAPLHNPVALRWIRAARQVLGPAVPQVAVFDTAFFTALPEVARIYAIPHELTEQHGLWRYGFHGLAHQAMWLGWREQIPGDSLKGKVISLQLGSGCSITATAGGVPQDTSMGFSPLEGLVMATRSGDIDAGLVTFLEDEKGFGPEQVDELLNERSGLSGVSGISADIRELLSSANDQARLAVDLYCYRARKYVGSYLAVLNGADAIIFGGGVGENAAVVREKILEGMEWCGIELDQKKNRDHDRKEISCISREASRVEVWVIPVNEAALLAQEAESVLRNL